MIPEVDDLLKRDLLETSLANSTLSPCRRQYNVVVNLQISQPENMVMVRSFGKRPYTFIEDWLVND